ncbi:MAG: metalloregulator ArsR/SmtB family transcription factor [Candidatus Woesearchaeota archaeon]
MICDSYYRFFNTVSHRMRWEILRLLEKKAMSVSEICEALGEEQSKVSHNLKKLVDCNFLDVQKEGRSRIYSLNKETILPLMELVEKHVRNYCGKKCWVRK